MSSAWNLILPIAYKFLSLAVKIAEIVKSKGIEEAGNLRLKDIEGWQEWSAEMLKYDGRLKFLEQLLKLKENLDDE